MRTLSPKGLEKLIEFEGKESLPYPDSGGKLTIGIGHLLTKSELTSGKIMIQGKPVKYREGLTEEQIKILVYQDLNWAENTVLTRVRVPLTVNQFDSLVIFCFNIGETAFTNSTLLKLLNAGNYDQVPTQMRRWVKDYTGKKVQGLINRREKEIKIWEENYA